MSHDLAIVRLDDGVPHRSGVEVAPGLYFCGFYLARTGMIREIASECRRLH